MRVANVDIGIYHLSVYQDVLVDLLCGFTLITLGHRR